MKNSLKIVSFNIRCVYNAEVDGQNSFIHRAGMIWEKIEKEKPDVVAFQEVTPDILTLLKVLMPDYTFHGHGRLKDYSGEGLYTAVKNQTVDSLGTEVFWIGPEPNKPESRFAEAGQSVCPRICVTSVLKHRKSEKLFRVYNVHLDHKAARMEGAQCVLSAIKTDNARIKLPAVLLGDFNDTPESAPVKLVSETMTDITTEFKTTFHAYGTWKEDFKIDYIFLSPEWEHCEVKTKLWKDKANGILLSDHYPVCATIKF